jgi:uncharacterized phage protein (TIGR02218 family)
MPRYVPPALAAHLAQPATTVCFLLKIIPKRTGVAVFGMTTLDADRTYDDGKSAGAITYRAKRGYTALDVDTKADLSVDNTEASGLVAEFPADGVTAEGIARGDYDGARFVQYLVNYEDLSMGHVVVNGGQIGQINMIDDLLCKIELRSLTQILKQNSIVELTSITCRAQFGDARCQMPLVWWSASVGTIGAEADRTFTADAGVGYTESFTGIPLGIGNAAQATFNLIDPQGLALSTAFGVSQDYAITEVRLNGVATTAYTDDGAGMITFSTIPALGVTMEWDGVITLPAPADAYFVPGIVEWLTGVNAGRQNEIEEYVSATRQITLAIPAHDDIAPGDTFRIRRDCDKSKAMCIAYGNLLRMRAEPELPRADGADLQSPTKVG